MTLTQMLQKIVKVERHEISAALASFAYFFCLLCGYYILRPVRDEMGISGGLANLPWLFTGTFIVMFAAVPVFGWASARLPRGTLLPAVYGFFIANLLIFYTLMTHGADMRLVAPAFFIWVSVFNLFVVSVFWSFMVDIYSEPQAQRLFGFIAAGGSAGALTGPALTAALAVALGTANLLLVSAAFLALALLFIYQLLNWAQKHSTPQRRARSGEPIGGSAWAGITMVARSPYLLGICAYMLLYSLLFSFVYFEQARIMAESYGASNERVRIFATLDFATNVLALLIQIFVVPRLFKWLGIAITLALLPALSAAGFVVLGLYPLLAVVVVFQVVRRAGEYAITKPARELLFTVVGREQKYKAKNFVDTVVFRGADAASGWLYAAAKGLGAGVSALSFIAAPLALGWMVLGWHLGKKQQAMLKTD